MEFGPGERRRISITREPLVEGTFSLLSLDVGLEKKKTGRGTYRWDSEDERASEEFLKKERERETACTDKRTSAQMIFEIVSCRERPLQGILFSYTLVYLGRLYGTLQELQ